MTEFARSLDGAREEFVESGAPIGGDGVSMVVRALTAALAGVDLTPQEPVQLGWSVRRNRGQA
ncbi:hypothetical protein ABZ517_29340 [Streptomyces scabiei]|uniref:hypothetical protein n=1 Tax=Streptomyces scabiei TaxID=1930 RepID=UPI0033F7A3BA